MYRKNLAFVVWLFFSILLLILAMLNIGHGSFLSYLVIILGSLMVVTLYRSSSAYKYSAMLLPSLIVSIISCIALLENYVVSLATAQDGITISNILAYMYIGEDKWSTGLFEQAYEISFSACLVLAMLFIVVIGFEWSKSKK
jgi:hypothetical protein